MSSPEDWDDGAADFAAAVLACRDEDTLALSEALNEQGHRGRALPAVGTARHRQEAGVSEDDGLLDLTEAQAFGSWVAASLARNPERTIARMVQVFPDHRIQRARDSMGS